MTSSESDSDTTATNLTKPRAQTKCDQTIHEAFRVSVPALVDALPAMGKSRGVVQWAADTGNPLTVFTARHDLYEQYAEWATDHSLIHKQLPSFHNDCETAQGDHSDEWKDRVLEEYQENSLQPKELHHWAEDLFDEPLPCQQEGECSYFQARDYDPDNYDIIIGHYRHAHVPEHSDDRYVVFDEFPDNEFLTEYAPGTVTEAVSEYLDRQNALPFAYPKELKQQNGSSEEKQEAIEWLESRNLNRDIDGVLEDTSGKAHPEAATMTYALLTAEGLENRWEYAELPDGGTAVRSPHDGYLIVLNPPDLVDAESIIGLDGTPTVEKWRLMLGDDMEHFPVLEPEEKSVYLHETLGIQVIQTTDAANHYSGKSGISLTPEKDLTVIEAVANREKPPALITTKRAKGEYKNHGVSELVEEIEHYGNFKGEDKFRDTRVAVIAGCPHYGDSEIEKWAALAGRSVSRDEETSGVGQDFGAFGNRFLHGMREARVLQAIMRFGRDAKGAKVYVHTGALPEWVEPQKAVEMKKWSDGMKEVISAIREFDNSEWRTATITEQVDISAQQVRNHLHTLEEFGYINCRTEGHGHMWSDKSIQKINQRGHVEFDTGYSD